MIVRLAFDTVEKIVREHFDYITETEVGPRCHPLPHALPTLENVLLDTRIPEPGGFFCKDLQGAFLVDRNQDGMDA